MIKQFSVTAALLASLLVFAPAESQAGGYFGGSVGQSYIDFDTGIPSVPETFDEQDFGWKALIGYEFGLPTINLGVEAGYVDFGAPSGDVLGSHSVTHVHALAAAAGRDGALVAIAREGVVEDANLLRVIGVDRDAHRVARRVALQILDERNRGRALIINIPHHDRDISEAGDLGGPR